MAVKKKKFLPLVIMALVIGVLTGLLIFVKSLAGNMIGQGADGLTGDEEGPTIISHGFDSITWISYTFCDESYRFERTEDGWKVAGADDFPLDASLVDMMEWQLTDIDTITEVQNPGDPAGFGLTEPYISVEFGDDKNGLMTIEIGDPYPFGSSRYFTVNGDGSVVYVTANALTDAFEKEMSDLLEESSTPVFDATDIVSVDVKLEASVWDALYDMGTESVAYSLYISDDGSLDMSGCNPWVYRAEDGTEYQAETDRLGDLFDKLSAVTFTKMVDYRTDMLDEYGISDDAVSIRYTVTDEETGEESEAVFRIRLGDEADDEHLYVNVDGTGDVWLWEKTTAEEIALTSCDDVRMGYICPLPLEDAVSVTLEGRSMKLNLVIGTETVIVDDDGEDPNEEPVTETVTTYTLNGVKLEDEAATDASRIYFNLTSLRDAGVPFDESSAGDVMLTADLVTSLETFPTYHVEIRELSDSYCMVVTGDGRTCAVSRRDVMTILDEMGVI